MRSQQLTRRLAAAASALDGLLAGATADRFLVGLPAWRRVGLVSWAAYSRNADLGTGRFFYPPLAFGGTILSIAASVSSRCGCHAPRRARVATAAAALLAASGLLLTLKAGPFMLSVPRLGDDKPALARAFGGFYRWSALRGACHVLAFGANIWSLAAMRPARR